MIAVTSYNFGEDLRYALGVTVTFVGFILLAWFWAWLTDPTRASLRRRHNFVRFLLGWGPRPQRTVAFTSRLTPLHVRRMDEFPMPFIIDESVPPGVVQLRTGAGRILRTIHLLDIGRGTAAVETLITDGIFSRVES